MTPCWCQSATRLAI